MRMSCNGCRVLRKGCSENCSIRPCLEWIKSPESQANATVFLAKFYGRAGLVNLINAGPQHLRPAIFRSLLYEACGRMVNPIHGSVGLLWSGQWQQCQTAVEAVFKGEPITPQVKGYDIRHVTKDQNSGSSSVESTRLKPTRTRFKKSRPIQASAPAMLMTSDVTELTRYDPAEFNGSTTTHDSSASYPDETTTAASMLSVETAYADVHGKGNDANEDGELELELTLGFGFGYRPAQTSAQLSQSSTSAGQIHLPSVQLSTQN